MTFASYQNKPTLAGASLRLSLTLAASTFALATAAQAQTAPPSDPAIADPPAEVVACTLDGATITCPAGLDANGFNDGTDGLTAVIQDGAYLQDTLDVDGDGNTVTVAATGTIAAEDRAIDLGETANLTNDGFLASTDDDGVRIDSGSTIVNNGTIFSNGDEAVEASDANNITITNTGLIIAGSTGDKGIEANENLTIVNSGTIASLTSEPIEADGRGLNLTNSGTIISPVDDAVDGDSDVTIVNTGLIQGGQNDGLELNNGTITNSGTILSTSSDPEGTPAVIGGPPELDAAIDFDAGEDGNEDGQVFNLAGGLIEGDIGIVGSPGNVDSPETNDGEQEIFNRGTITGRMGDAALLGNGDDSFFLLNDGVVNGTVKGQAGDDIFGVAITDATDRSFNLSLIGDEAQFRSFEEFRFGSTTSDEFGEASPGSGTLSLTGTLASGADLFGNVTLDGTINGEVEINDDDTTLNVGETGMIDNDDGRAIDGRGVSGFTLTNAGLIQSSDSDAIDVSGSDGTMITNTGNIFATANDSKAIDGGENLTVINSGIIRASNGDGKGVEGDENLTIVNMADGLIEALGQGAEAVEADAGGLNLTNAGTIRSEFDDGVDGDDNVTIVNSGLISGNNNDGLELNSGTITNSGTIISLASDPEGSLVIGGTTPELDAAIDFDAGTDGNEDGVINNLAGGLIEGDIGINSSAGNQDSPDTNDGVQQIFNNGTITGRMGDAVLLGNGDDIFVQQENGVVNGIVNGEAGNDTLLLGSSDGATGTVDVGLFSSDQFIGFEAFGFSSNGSVIATGSTNVAVTLFNGSVEITGELNNGLVVTDGTQAMVRDGGTVAGSGGAAITLQGASSVIVDDGGFVTGTPAIVGDAASQQVVNRGSLVGNSGPAVSLGDGNDVFTQGMTGSVIGLVDLGAGDDTFILNGTASALGGGISGGAGNDSASLAGTFDADILSDFATITVGDTRFVGSRTVAGNVVFSGEAVFDLNVDSLGVSGDIAAANGSTITVLTTTPVSQLPINTAITVFNQSGSFTDNGTTVTVVDDDLLVDYTVTLGSLLVTPVAVNPAAGSADANAFTLGAQFQTALSIGTLGANFADTINNLVNTAAFEQAANGLLPFLNGSVSREIFESSNLASRALDQHLAQDGSTGGVWGQFGYRTSEQDALAPTLGGYESDQLVYTLGVDTDLGGGAIIGLVASYADIDIDDQSNSAERIEIESYKISAYGSLSFGDGGFINGELGYSSSDVETQRTSLFGPIAGDFDVDAFLSRVVAGYRFAAGNNVSIIPSAGLNYAYLEFDEYTETGGLALGVTRDEVQFFEGRLALTGEVEFDSVTLQLTGGYVHDFDSDQRNAQLLTLGTPSFVVGSQAPAEDRLEIDGTLAFDVMENGSILVGYNGEFTDNYDSHAGVIRFRFGF